MKYPWGFKKKVKSTIKVKKQVCVDTREEAEWIRENCTKKFSIDDIMEILDYEMGYLTTLGLTDLTKEEFQENLEYWASRNG